MTIAHHCNWQVSSVKMNCTCISIDRDLRVWYHGLEIRACPERTTVLEPNELHVHLH